MIARWLTVLAIRAVLRVTARIVARLLVVAAGAALLVAAAPVTLVAVASAGAAWLGGWPPARLYRAAAWQLPMVVAWLVLAGADARSATAALLEPYRAWLAMWHLAAAGDGLRALIGIAPAALPLGLVAGGLAWAARLRAMSAAAAGASPGSAVAFDRRQWRHQARAARARIAAPGAVPLTTRAGDVVVGAVIRAVGHPVGGGLARLPYARLRAHQVVIGGTGTGKTTLLLRLWAAFMATAMRRHAAGQGRPPLLVVLDCKGGADARRVADRTRRVLRGAGARRTAVWPDDARLSIWSLPPRQLVTTLVDLVEHGSGGAAYYADVLDAIVSLAVSAPCGPPASGPDFLSRLDAGWLTRAWLPAGRGPELELIRSSARQVADVALRYRTLFRRLGAGLDGPGDLDDADAWYCILEGTAEVAVAEAQARALIDLLAAYITSGPARREVLLAVDEFSAVSRRLPIWSLYERGRSLGLAVQVSAQSWHGLAPDDTDRYRIVSAAEGGVWLLRTPHPEPVAGLVGERPAVDTTRRLAGTARWTREGSSRLHEVPVADPALIRGLAVGQAAYLYRGGVTYIQVSRLVAAPAALAPPPAAGPGRPPAVPAAAIPSAIPPGTGGPAGAWPTADGRAATEPGGTDLAGGWPGGTSASPAASPRAAGASPADWPQAGRPDPGSAQDGWPTSPVAWPAQARPPDPGSAQDGWPTSPVAWPGPTTPAAGPATGRPDDPARRATAALLDAAFGPEPSARPAPQRRSPASEDSQP
jgi:hypothetical protein